MENAVKHGVEPSPSGAQLRVSTRLRNQVAVIKVTNTVVFGAPYKVITFFAVDEATKDFSYFRLV